MRHYMATWGEGMPKALASRQLGITPGGLRGHVAALAAKGRLVSTGSPLVPTGASLSNATEKRG